MKEFILIVALWACVQAKLVRVPLETLPPNELIEFHPIDHTALNVKDEIYARISIGNPPQTFLMGFDTSIYGILVSSSNCTANATYCLSEKPNKYNSDDSSTYIADGTRIWYFALRNVPSGFLSTDEVVINGSKIQNQTFTEITDYSTYYPGFDGIVGLSDPWNLRQEPRSFLNQMLEQKLIDALIFSFHFVSDDDANGSELVLGGVDPNHYEGEITYVPVINKETWEIFLDNVFVRDDINKTIMSSYGSSIYLQTNSGEIRGPVVDIEELHEAIGGVRYHPYENGFYTVNCSNIASLPDVTFTIGGKDFSLTSKEYVFESNATGDLKCFSRFRGDYITTWKFGSVFMRKYLTVFDSQNHRVGFAKSV